jgi:hypothetical protein
LLKIVSPGRAETIRSYVGARKNLRILADYTKRFAPTRVHVCHDMFDLSQGALHFAKQINPAARGVYVEDGSGAYLPDDNYTIAETRKRRLFRRLLIDSPWFEPVLVHGTTRWIDECVILFPDLRAPGATQRPAREPPRDALTDPEFVRWNGDLLSRYGANVGSLADVGCVLPVPAATGRENVAAWKRIVDLASEAMRRQGLRTAVKYHPREFLTDYLDVAARPDIVILPQRTSMENVVLQLLPHLRCMIGDTSSCLLSAKWMSPAANVIACAGTTSNTSSKQFVNILAKAG